MEWQFAGREAELEQLRSWLVDPAARGAVVVGPAGVGKTRLGLELLRHAEELGMAVGRAVATGTRIDLPFGAVASLVSEEWWRGTQSESIELAQRLAAAIVAEAGGRRFVLLVDDAHLLDDGSAMIIHRLVLRNEAFVIATMRAGETAPASIASLWKEDLIERIDLTPLSVAAIDQIVSDYLAAPISGALSMQLAGRSQGNMLFVRELLLGALAEGAVRNESGVWHLVGELHPSRRLVETVESRMAGVSDEEREALELLALGEPLTGAETEALIPEHVADSLEHRGLLTLSLAQGRFTTMLGHPIYGEALRSGMSAGRVRRLTRRLAETVEATELKQTDDLLRVAGWRLRCGGGRMEILLGAARVAFDRYDYVLAEELAEAAVASGGGFEAELLLAQIATQRGDNAGAERSLAELAMIAADDETRTRVALARVDNAVLWMRLDHLLHVCDDGLAQIQDQGQRSALAARRLWGVLYTAGPRRALEECAVFPEEYDDPALLPVAITRAYALSHRGRTTESLATTAAAEEAHRAAAGRFNWPIGLHVIYRCAALAAAGRFVEMARLATVSRQEAIADGSTMSQAYAAHVLALASVERGRVRDAVRYAREACALFDSTGERLPLSQALLGLTYACSVAGESRSAAEALARFEALDLGSMRWHTEGRLHAAAWSAAAAGDIPQAVRLLEGEAALAAELGDVVQEGRALHGLVRVGHAGAARVRLCELAEEVEGDLAGLRAEHADASVARDARRLGRTAEAFEEIGADLLAAEVAADCAIAWRQDGEVRAALAAEHYSAELLARCDGASTPATLSVVSRARLTTAERETALLASRGRSNKDIAHELCISVRTVESRLQNVYSKLGISRRSALAESLAQISAES